VSAALSSGSVDGSLATSGAISARGPGSESSSDAAATNQSSDGKSSVRGGIFQLGIWLSLIFVMLMLLPIAIWAVVKAVRRSEASQSDEVVYQTLQDARHIYGKIIKK
jgi:hypothetical protein